MGYSVTPVYRVEFSLTNPHQGMTPVAWDTRKDGRASLINLTKLVESFNASFQPGSTNEHIGEKGMIVEAWLIRQSDDTIVAHWSEV